MAVSEFLFAISKSNDFSAKTEMVGINCSEVRF